MSSVRGPVIGLSVLGVVAVCWLSLVMTGGRGPAAVADVDTEYTAVFTDVSGLTTGSGVQLAGARIGTVTAIDVTDGATARVGFTVGHDRPVLDTTHATVRYQRILGQYYLDKRSLTYDFGSLDTFFAGVRQGTTAGCPTVTTP